MKSWMIGAACAAALMGAGAAYAQSPANLTGTWAFHTADYSPDPQYSLHMSGVADLRRSGRGRYTIRLMTQEVPAQGSQFTESWARQNCTGVAQGDALEITCTVASSSSDQYQADNFQLNVQADGTMTGQLVSNVTAPVVFRKFR
jgi:hypothetical protein